MPSTRRITKNTVRLRPEQLEDRAVPAVYTVLGTADQALPGTISATGPGTFNASSLRAAVLAANQSAEDDTIVLQAGTYTLTVDGRFDDTGATGDLDVREVSLAGKLTVVGAGRGATTITQSFTANINAITNVSGTNPIVITSAGHGLTTGDLVEVNGVRGVSNANNTWQVTVLTADTFQLNGSNGNGQVYSGGGVWSLDGEDERDRLFDTQGGDLTLKNLLLTGGFAVSSEGGAVRVQQGSLTLNNVAATGNTAEDSGGAISVSNYSYGSFFGLQGQAGGLRISNSLISNNTVEATFSSTSYGSGGEGGGIAFLSVGGVFSLTDSVVTGNTIIGGGEGGGVSLASYFTTSSTITRSVISGNTILGEANNEARGGGLFTASFTYAQSTGGLSIVDSTISGNRAVGGSGTNDYAEDSQGGGVYARGALSILRSTVSGNFAEGGSNTVVDGFGGAGTGLGGGIFISGGEGFSLVNSTVSGNQALGGTITGGEAGATGFLYAGDAQGGGVFLGFSGSFTNITNSTIANNSAVAGSATTTGTETLEAGFASGGGIVGGEGSNGVVTLASSLVATNTAVNALDPTSMDGPDLIGGFLTLGNNLIGNGDGSTGFTNGTAGDIVGTTAAPVNPVIGALANNGGLTQTHALLDGSPAINTGSNLSGLTTDQRGVDYYRVFGGAADIGAFEAQSAYVPVISVGSAGGGPAQLRVLNADGSVKFADLNPFPGFTGSVYTATADFNGDRIDDIVAGAGVGGGPVVKVFDGATGAEIASFYAFTAFSRGGVSVATGDVNGDGTPDIIVGAGVGGGPRVIAIDGTKLNQTVTIDAEQYIADSALLASFFAFDANWRGGITVAFADGQYVLGRGGFSVDLIDGVFVPTGPGLTAEVAIADLSGTVLKVIQVFDNSFVGGVNVAAGGGQIAVAPGFGGGPRVQVYNTAGGLTADFYAFDPALTGGASVGVFGFGTDLSLLVGAGPGGGPQVNVYSLDGLQNSFFGLDADFTGGVFVG